MASIEPGSKASRTAGLRPGLVLLSAQDMEASPGSDVRERVIRKLQTANLELEDEQRVEGRDLLGVNGVNLAFKGSDQPRDRSLRFFRPL